MADVDVMQVDGDDDSDGEIQLKGDGSRQEDDEEAKAKFTDINVLDTVKRDIAEEDAKKKASGQLSQRGYSLGNFSTNLDTQTYDKLRASMPVN